MIQQTPTLADTAATRPPWLGRRLALPRMGQRRLLFDTVILALAGVAAAQLFNFLLRLSSALFLGRLAGYHPPGLVSEGATPYESLGPYRLWLLPAITTLGGLLVGLMTEWLAPEAEGHGTDAVVRAFHRAGGALRARVAPVKLVASAITIGSGGAAGREGPIALISAGIGSWYAAATGRDERDRRLLLLVGAAAGLAAIFRSPIGAAFFVIEVLYADMEFESSALLYTTLAAVIAYAANGLFVGWGPLFTIPGAAPLPSPFAYTWYALLGIAAGLVATALPYVFYRTRDAFRALPVRPYLKPAIGGLLTGLVILAFPQVIAGGYGWVQSAIDGRMGLELLAALALAKMLAMSFTVASGGSGGVFAPSLFIGAMLGGVLAAIGHEPAAPFVVVGMAAVFAGAAHVPFATMMMVTEMTGGYTLLVPAALAVMLSYLVQSRLGRGLRYRRIYEAQVDSRVDSPAHHTQHVRGALRILREQQLGDLRDVGEIDLVALLRMGIPVEMAGGRRLVVMPLREQDEVVGTTVAASGRKLAGIGTNVIAILRGDRVVTPRVDTTFKTGDRVILVTGENGGSGARNRL
jgi:CIC family chloride channel protein